MIFNDGSCFPRCLIDAVAVVNRFRTPLLSVGVVLSLIGVLIAVGLVLIDSPALGWFLLVSLFAGPLCVIAAYAGRSRLEEDVPKIFWPPYTRRFPAGYHLQPEVNLNWTDSATVDTLVAEILASGFEDCGQFRVVEDRAVKFWAFLHPHRMVWAEVDEHAAFGVSCNLFVQFAGGGSASFTNTKAGHHLDHRPGHDKHFDKNASFTALLQRCDEACAGKEVMPASKDNLVAIFERYCAEQLLWRNSRGGFTLDETRRIAKEMHGIDNEMLIRGAHLRQRVNANALFDKQIKRLFRRQNEMSDEQWNNVQHRLLFVHDNMDRHQAAALIPGFKTIESPLPTPTDQTARQFFAIANQTLHPDKRFMLIGHVDGAVPTDVYVTPDVNLSA